MTVEDEFSRKLGRHSTEKLMVCVRVLETLGLPEARQEVIEEIRLRNPVFARWFDPEPELAVWERAMLEAPNTTGVEVKTASEWDAQESLNPKVADEYNSWYEN